MISPVQRTPSNTARRKTNMEDIDAADSVPWACFPQLKLQLTARLWMVCRQLHCAGKYYVPMDPHPSQLGHTTSPQHAAAFTHMPLTSPPSSNNVLRLARVICLATRSSTSNSWSDKLSHRREQQVIEPREPRACQRQQEPPSTHSLNSRQS